VKAWITIADYAQVHAGKLFIVGGGITTMGPGALTFGVAVQVVAPWEDRSKKQRLRCALFTVDGEPVNVPTPTGQTLALEAVADFEVVPAPGSPQGSELPFAFAFNVGNVPLPPGSYEWRLFIANEAEASATASFHVRKVPA
jgi:hypothetical protein